MPFDIALDKETGDWVWAPNVDLMPVLGDQTVAQRIWIRLRMEQGWALDPTDGRLGSQLRTTALRVGRARAINEIPLMVRAALAPMTDVQVDDVTVEPDGDNPRSAIVSIVYSVIETDDQVPLDAQSQDVLSFSVAT